MSEEKRKMTFLQWLENFWYYHKWKVIAGVLLIIALWAGITLYIDTLKKSENTGDITVVSVFSGAYTNKKMNLEERLVDSVKDLVGRDAAGKRPEIRPLDHGTFRGRIGEGDTQLDQVRAVFDRGTYDRSCRFQIGIAAGDEGNEGFSVCKSFADITHGYPPLCSAR